MADLNIPAPSPSPSAINANSTQLLSNPNIYQVPQMQQRQRMGYGYGGLQVPGQAQSSWPQAGLGTGMSQLSQNPMQANNMMQMIAALQGQRHG
jgi:hypothetical protein